MACFPGLAQADENSDFQYIPDVPTVPNHESSKDPSGKNSGSNDQSEPDAEASGSDPDGGAAGGNGGSGTGGGANTGQGNQGTGGGDGKGAGGADRAGGELKDAKPIADFDGAAASSDDGSSPLVPILIAIAVLAAISVGAFFYRQRRQDPTSPVSPKAS